MITATSEGQQGAAAVSVASIPTHTFVVVTAGGAHTCALTPEGAAYCWGRDESGQVGAPPTSSCTLDAGVFPCAPVPVAVAGGLTFTQITGGGAHTCALSGDGTAYCWGSNESGQLGDNSTTGRTAPVPVATPLRFTVLDAGASHTCGLSSGGVAYCWGRNDRGQLGDGTTTNRSVPVAVSGGLTFQAVTAGGFDIGHSCGLVAGGAAYCWGDNERGQLGIGTSDIVPHPVPASVTGGLALVSLTAGLGRHTCGLTGAGAAYCWGENTFGALGDGSTTDRLTPVTVFGGLVFAKLRAGGFIGHTCGVTGGGAAYCWGENERGQVGDGSTTDRSSPSPVGGGLSFASLDAGFRHTCARATSGTLYCWGSGAAGQLGTNSTSQRNVPAKVLGQP
jgi:alpha-tubulin suppressor-like RCC1 family protein